MRNPIGVQLYRIMLYFLMLLCLGSVSTYAADRMIQSDYSRASNVECRSGSGAIIPIVDQRIEVPIKTMTSETSEEKIIVYDRRRFADVPRYILLFEQARQCAEISSHPEPVDTGRRAPPSSTMPSSETRLTEDDLDCLAINLMRSQSLITSQELQEIAQFYARWGDVEKREKGDPRRGRHISGCFKYYKQYKTIAPPKSLIIK